MPLPYQSGTPTLIPNFFGSVVNLDGTMSAKSPADMVAANPRTLATATLTIGGTITAADTVTMTLTQSQLPSGSESVTHTVITAETVQDVAESLSSQLNQALRAAGVASAIYATTGYDTVAHEAIVTVNWEGPLGNTAVLTATKSGGASENVTVAPSGGELTGGGGVAFAAANFNYSYNGVLMSFYYGKAYQLDTELLAQMAADDEPIV